MKRNRCPTSASGEMTAAATDAALLRQQTASMERQRVGVN